jgi:hypothetical protein
MTKYRKTFSWMKKTDNGIIEPIEPFGPWYSLNYIGGNFDTEEDAVKELERWPYTVCGAVLITEYVPVIDFD